MKNRIVITDLTRMRRGAVCISGYDKDHHCIRPITFYPGILESTILISNEPIVYPFSLVELELLDKRPEPPHTEDQYFVPGSFQFIQDVKDRKRILTWSLFNSVQNIFEQPILFKPGSHIKDGQGPRSVGTIHAKAIVGVHFDQGPENTWDFRLSFYDYSDTYYRLKITDLTFLYYLSSLRTEDSQPLQIADKLTKVLKKMDVYLRIGLSRGWARFPDLCFLQVNGIYTFPDLYEGRKFSDYRNFSAHGIAESPEEA